MFIMVHNHGHVSPYRFQDGAVGLFVVNDPRLAGDQGHDHFHHLHFAKRFPHVHVVPVLHRVTHEFAGIHRHHPCGVVRFGKHVGSPVHRQPHA